MRLLFVSNIPPYQPGGAETQALKIAAEFVRAGHSVVIAGNRIPGGMETFDGVEIRTVRIPVLEFSRASRALSYALSLAAVYLWYYRKIDLVYCRFVREAAVSIALLKRLLRLRRPLVACAACTGEFGDARFISGLPYSGFMVETLNRYCDRINNISPATADDLAGIGIRRAIMCGIPNGIAIPELPVPVSRGSGPKRLVYLGRLHPQKGLGFLFSACAALRESGVDVSLDLIGDGPERRALEHRCREQQLETAVRFLGHIPNDTLGEYLCRADLFVMSSLCEGFATVVIEAMAVGLPVVVTRCGGPEYFVDEQVGRVCPSADSVALETAMRELLQMKPGERTAMGQRGRARVIERFSIRSVYTRYLELFTALCNAD